MQKSLHRVASEFAQELALLHRLDAFGDHGEIETLADANHRGDDGPRAGVAFDVAAG